MLSQCFHCCAFISLYISRAEVTFNEFRANRLQDRSSTCSPARVEVMFLGKDYLEVSNTLQADLNFPSPKLVAIQDYRPKSVRLFTHSWRKNNKMHTFRKYVGWIYWIQLEFELRPLIPLCEPLTIISPSIPNWNLYLTNGDRYFFSIFAVHI